MRHLLLLLCMTIAAAGEPALLEKTVVDLNKPIKIRIADGLPGDRTDEGKLRVVGTTIIQPTVPSDELVLPYWLVRRVSGEDMARLNPSQLSVLRMLRDATEEWRASRQKIVECEYALSVAQQGAATVEDAWASTQKAADKAKRAMLPSEIRSLTSRREAAKKRQDDAQAKLATVLQIEGPEEARLRGKLREAWGPVLEAFRKQAAQVDLGEVAKPVEAPPTTVAQP